MLVNSKEMLENAKKGKYAVPQFNINNLEWAKNVLEKCQEYDCPVILGVSEGALKYMGGANTIVGMVNGLIKDLSIAIPVCIHLDHGGSFDVCKKVIDAGFTSVMIDGSKFPLEENIRVTKEVVDYAHKHNVTVEAEVGHIGGTEDNVSGSSLNATLEDCLAIVSNTELDSLAPALGSVHGYYKGNPNLDFVTMQQVNESVTVPLVLHGGTGIPEVDIKKAISCGISKININTELQGAWHQGVVEGIMANKEEYDPRKVIGFGKANMMAAIEAKINLFLNR